MLPKKDLETDKIEWSTIDSDTVVAASIDPRLHDFVEDVTSDE